MVNHNKLIARFLILAVISGSLAFILSKFHSQSSQTGKKSYISFINQNSNNSAVTPLAKNAFINSANIDINNAAVNPNLSQIAGESLAKIVIGLNPDGPREINGESSFVLPDKDLLTLFVAATLPNFKIEDLWSKVEEKDFNVVNSYSVAGNIRYAESFRKIIRQTINHPDFLNLISGSSGSGFINYAALVFNKAAVDMRQLAVPLPFLTFHKNFVQYLEDQRNIFLAISNSNDPLKALIVLRSQEEIKNRINQDYKNLTSEYLKLDFKKLFAQKNSKIYSLEYFLRKIFSIEKVFALVLPGGSIPTPPGGDVIGIPVSIPTVPSDIGGTLTPQDGETTPEDSYAAACNPEEMRKSNAFLNTFGKMFDPSAIKDIAEKVAKKTTGILAVPVSGVGENDVSSAMNLENLAKNLETLVQIEGDELTLMVVDCNRKYITEQFKSKLTQTITAQAVEHIQNSGNPRFITNYGDYFSEAEKTGKSVALKQTIPNLCQEFQPLVQDVMSSPVGDASDLSGIFSGGNTSLGSLTSLFSGLGGIPGLGGISIPSLFGSSVGGGGCPLDQIAGGSAQNFYNDFNNGGWLAYGASTLPSGNYSGSLFTSAQIVGDAAQNAKEAAKTESQSNAGYKSDTSCVEYFTDENGNQRCAKEMILTPGKTVAENVHNVINLGEERVVNATDFDFMTLSQEVADSLGTQLISQSNRGLYNLSLSPTGGANLSSLCSGLGGSSQSLCSGMIGNLTSLISNPTALLNNLMGGLLGNIGGSFGF